MPRGKLQPLPDKGETIKATLIAFDYPKDEARYLAKQIQSNLNVYTATLNRLSDNRTLTRGTR
jgi:hypothetical protein